MIRIGQLGWDRDSPAETVDDVTLGIGVYWVEINGVRIERVMRAEVIARDDEFTVPRIVLDIADGVQIVYVDRDGDPLPGEPVDTDPVLLNAAGPMEHRSVVRREDV